MYEREFLLFIVVCPDLRLSLSHALFQCFICTQRALLGPEP